MVSPQVHGAETIRPRIANQTHFRKLISVICGTTHSLNKGGINMGTKLQNNLWAREHMTLVTLTRGIGWGLIAGFVGTLVMDLILMGALSATGRPAFTCFSIIGDTAARLFSKFGTEITGGIPVGMAAHYLMGPIVGAIFGAAVVRIDVLRVDTLKKGVILAVLYVEILSQPILAATPVLLKMTALTTLLWFGGSFVMHLIWGIVVGAVVSYGLRFKNYRKPQMIGSTTRIL
jgi:hypothetical protein